MTTAALPVPRFDSFYRHTELTSLLEGYALARPNLVQLRSLGKSHEGRDIWLLVITNTATGADVDKHLGYAVQWFAMAAAAGVTALYLFLSLLRHARSASRAHHD